MPSSSSTSELATTARHLIDHGGVITLFQPILSAKQRSMIGAEALSRGVVGVEATARGAYGAIAAHGQVIQPKDLFRIAAEEGLSLELDRVCRRTAMRSFKQLKGHEELILFLNFDASVLENDSTVFTQLVKDVERAGLSPRQVAVEILESAFSDAQWLRRQLEEFRGGGFLLALDDVGAGYSNLDRIPLIRPDLIKLDRSLAAGIEDDYFRQETFKSLVQLSRRIGALVVAEGIETQQQAILALELGADLLQGYFLGKPQHADQFADKDVAARIEALARQYKVCMTSRINHRKLQHRRFNIIINEILCELAARASTHFEAVLRTMIDHYANVECVYVIDETGRQVTQTVCNDLIPHRSNGVMFRPASVGTDHSLKEYYYVLLDVELQKFTTDPYVSLASGNLCRTISTTFRDSPDNKLFILCIDVLCE